MASQNNYTVLIGQSHDDVEREKKIVDTMRRHRVDGLLVSLSKNTVSYDHFEQLKTYSIPVVFFDRVESINSTTKVVIDNYRAGYKATQHLIDQGCKKIATITAKFPTAQN